MAQGSDAGMQCQNAAKSRRKYVEVTKIITEIDAQIKKLQQARELLSGLSSVASKGPGRPKGSKNSSGTTKKRKLSPEGRRRIQEAMKRRWAERRKTVAKGTAAKGAAAAK
jgi:hypothetical protein